MPQTMCGVSAGRSCAARSWADLTPEKADPPCSGVAWGNGPMSVGTAHGHKHSSWVYEIPTAAPDAPGGRSKAGSTLTGWANRKRTKDFFEIGPIASFIKSFSKHMARVLN